jgi:hypothetical protein
MSAEKAILNYSKRQLRGKSNGKKKAKNKSPEKEVEKEVLEVCEKLGLDVNVIESKATYSVSAGRYLRGQVDAGFTDLVGNTNDGRAVYIELKARGRLSTIKPHQLEFIIRKIRTGAFGCVVDGGGRLGDLFSRWSILLRQSRSEAEEYLIKSLPKQLEDFDKSSGQDELPW